MPYRKVGVDLGVCGPHHISVSDEAGQLVVEVLGQVRHARLDEVLGFGPQGFVLLESTPDGLDAVCGPAPELGVGFGGLGAQRVLHLPPQ